jgi:uncharacterized lipoprotein YddW (UPF0748 family)
MRKMTISMLILLMTLSIVSITYSYEPVSSQTQTATGFLQVRPGSNKTNSTLTLTQLNNYLFQVKSFVNTANTKMYDINYDLLNSRIQAIETQMTGVTTTMFTQNFQTYYNLYEELFSIYGQAIESRVVDGRGMWHRPFESNLTQVRTTLQEMKDMNINMLYVETFWMGRLIYRSSVPGTYQHSFTLGEGYGEYGDNLLLAFVEEGKNYGIEVHAWVENFFVGYGTSYTDSPILANKPEWASYNYDYSIPQRTETNYLFMDPANPEVRRYLKEIYAEIVTIADVGSLHLDYIRYPVAKDITSTNPVNNKDTGYSDFAEAEFKMLYNRQGDLRNLVVTNTTVASEWRSYKVSVITDFVKGVYYTVKNVNPDVGLSTAIFGNVTSAITEKAQDWATWASLGLIEIITPMSYYQSSSTVASETQRLTDLVGNNAFSYAGLAPTYMGYNEYLNTTQVQAALYSNAQGTVFFASQFYMFSRNDYALNQKSYALEVQQVLTEGVYRKKSVNPHDDPALVISTQLNYTIDKANRIFVPRSGMTQTNLNALITELNRIQAMPVSTAAELLSVINEFKALFPSMYASGAARDRILEDRNYLVKVLELKHRRMILDVTIDISVNPDPDVISDPVTLSQPQNVRIQNNQIVWDAVPHALRYELIQTQGVTEKVFQVSGTSYQLSQLFPGQYAFKVRAIGDGFFYMSSSLSLPLSYDVESLKLSTPNNLRIVNQVILFDAVPNATAYRIVIDFSDFTITTTSMNLAPFNLTPGTYQITVQALGNGFAILDSDVSSVVEYIIPKVRTAAQLEIIQFRNEVIKSILYYRETKTED